MCPCCIELGFSGDLESHKENEGSNSEITHRKIEAKNEVAEHLRKHGSNIFHIKFVILGNTNNRFINQKLVSSWQRWVLISMRNDPHRWSFLSTQHIAVYSFRRINAIQGIEKKSNMPKKLKAEYKKKKSSWILVYSLCPSLHLYVSMF